MTRTCGSGHKVPVDKGWAWCVMIGATIQMMLSIGIMKSSGILFVAFQEKFSSTSSVTSLLSTVQNISYSLMALVVMTLGTKLTSCRNLLFVGSVLSSVSYVITSRATDIRLLLFSHGVLQGTGQAFMQPTAVNMVGLYFEKKRGFANSIAISGGSLGGLILAPLITRMFSFYGYQGCVLIIGGIFLHGFVSGALFRPVDFYHRRKRAFKVKRKVTDEEDHELVNTQDLDVENEMIENVSDILVTKLILEKPGKELENEFIGDSRGRKRSYSASQTDRFKKIDETFTLNAEDNSKMESTLQRASSDFFEFGRMKKNFRISNINRVISSSVSAISYPSLDFVAGSTMNIQILAEEKSPQESVWKSVVKTLSDTFDFHLFKQPVFNAFLLSGSLICPGTVLAPVFVAPYSNDIGISADDIATLVTVQSSVDLCARIFVGFISDKGFMRRSTMIALATILVSISAHFVRFYTTFTAMLFYSVVLGLVSGIYFILYAVVIVDYMTVEKLHSCLGFLALFHGFAVAGTFYLIGFLRDVTGSYVMPYHTIGAITLLGALIMYCLPFLRRETTDKKKTTDTESTSSDSAHNI